jgi:site-specific DNA-cytosine methylase
MGAKMQMDLVAIDLCSGAGGWACAARGLPIQIVLAIDFWEPACKTYELNHPQTKVLRRDLRESGTLEIIRGECSRIDLVLGGIPCEWLSVYRNLTKVTTGQLAEQRATLDALIDITKALEPQWWCLEDVVQIEKEIPILTPSKRIDAKHFSAQRRKRAFVGRFPSPQPAGCQKVLKDVLRPGPWRVGARSFDRTPVITQNFNGRCSLAAIPDRKSPTVLSWCSRRDAEVVLVDDALPGGKRQIEWQEAAALQGFPEDYLFYGSPGQVGKMIGRAVQIDTARAILGAILAEAEGQTFSGAKL